MLDALVILFLSAFIGYLLVNIRSYRKEIDWLYKRAEYSEGRVDKDWETIKALQGELNEWKTRYPKDTSPAPVFYGTGSYWPASSSSVYIPTTISAGYTTTISTPTASQTNED